MCGITAYYETGGFSQARLKALMDALAGLNHRGPDGEGIVLVDTRSGQQWTLQSPDRPRDLSADLDFAEYEDRQADLFLGHRRLSIFDLSSAGHQPMRDAGGNLLNFNGEVYNFLELREELKAKGFAFSTGTDTEVILAAYREWGPDCLKRFNGMWSMLLYDQDQRKLLVTNDRAGIKQLYQFRQGDSWMLASEIKAIRSIFGEQLNLHREHARFFLDHSVLDFSSATLFREIERVPAAHFALHAPKDAPQFKPYWEFPTQTRKFASLQDAAAECRELFSDAIRLRMRSDVPWGTTLSGGLDSSAIVYLAHALQKDVPINTFTASFPNEEGDETSYVRFIEQDLGTHARYTNPLEEFDFEDFARHLRHQDQPVTSTSVYAQWSVMKLVGRSEVKVLLDGQGGDELFGGYHHHVYKLGRDLYLKGKFRSLKRLVEEFCALKGKSPEEIRKFIRDDAKLYLKLKAGGKLPGPDANMAWNKARSLRDVLRLDLQSWVMPNLLRYEDRNSMAFGIESRLPLLDYRLVEFAAALPDAYKIREGWQKVVLREAVHELPEKIRYRKDKKGFSTPENDWVTRYADQFRQYAQYALDAGVAPPWQKNMDQLHPKELFRIGNLGLWLSDK